MSRAMSRAMEDADTGAQAAACPSVTIFHPLDESAQVQGALRFTSMGWVRLKPMTRGFVEAHRSGTSACKKDPDNALRARVVAAATRRAQESGIVFSTADLVRTTPKGTVFHPMLLYDLLAPKSPDNKVGIAPLRAKTAPDPNADAIAMIPTWCDIARQKARISKSPNASDEHMQTQENAPAEGVNSPAPIPWSERRHERGLDERERELLASQADAQTGAYDVFALAGSLGLLFDELLRSDAAVARAVNRENLDAEANGGMHDLHRTTFAVAEAIVKCARLEENEEQCVCGPAGAHSISSAAHDASRAVNFEENAALVPRLCQSSDSDDLAEVARALSDTQSQLKTLMQTISALQVRMQV